MLLQLPTNTRDEYGQKVESFSDFGRLWGRVEPLAGKELLEARQIKADVTHRVTIRWRDDVTEKMQFKLGTRTLRIAEAPRAADERREFLEMACVERK
jgi:SPP1 family predicted phage head-tail adaptor